MAAAAISSLLPSHPTILCPPPLQFHARPRKATIRRRMLRKATQTQKQPVHGPLDDIIADIKSDILESPPEYVRDSLLFDWGNPLKAPSTWAVTPLPVSRAPSNQPLNIRKNRGSRSSASGSSIDDSMSYSRNSSQDKPTGDSAAGASISRDTVRWPSLNDGMSHISDSFSNTTHTTTHKEHATVQQSLENAVERSSGNVGSAPQRRPSRLRIFTNGFPRLRRMGTRDTSISTSSASNPTSPTLLTTPPVGSGSRDEPDDGVVVAGMKSLTQFSMMERMVTRLPFPSEHELELLEEQYRNTRTVPTTLRAAIRIYPEIKMLSEHIQEFTIAVEIEGVLHNRSSLSCGTIDMVFVVDNGYYVTRDCLKNATEAVNGALYHMQRGDRLALYTTHCAHNTVTGNKPELHHPLQPFTADSEDMFQELTDGICRCGTQAWEPVRPNPSMSDVLLGVARSLENQDLKQGRAHIILLSPVGHVLHDVSKTFPDLVIHHINPATLPYRCKSELQNTVCFETCCKNVFVSNWTTYQCVPWRIKRILKNARSQSHFGELTDVSVDVRVRDGCELLEWIGPKDVPQLRLGQVHTSFAKIRVNQNRTRKVDLDSLNPIFNSSLDLQELRKDLQNATALGAVKVHLLDVQLYHRNSIHRGDCWNYTEAPFTTFLELGRMTTPLDAAMEVYKRLYFHKFIHMSAEEAEAEAENLLLYYSKRDNPVARQLFEQIYQEIQCQAEIREYEQNYRQKLPLCPGPTDTAKPHEWMLELWNKV